MPLLSTATVTEVPRSALAEVFKDPRLLLAIEAVLQIAAQVPDAINAIADAGMWLQTPAPEIPNARVVIPGVGVTLDYSTPGQVTLNVAIGITGATTATGLVSAEDDAAAAAAGVPLNGVYLNGSVLQARQL